MASRVIKKTRSLIAKERRGNFENFWLKHFCKYHILPVIDFMRPLAEKHKAAGQVTDDEVAESTVRLYDITQSSRF